MKHSGRDAKPEIYSCRWSRCQVFIAGLEDSSRLIRLCATSPPTADPLDTVSS